MTNPNQTQEQIKLPRGVEMLAQAGVIITPENPDTDLLIFQRQKRFFQCYLSPELGNATYAITRPEEFSDIYPAPIVPVILSTRATLKDGTKFMLYRDKDSFFKFGLPPSAEINERCKVRDYQARLKQISEERKIT